MLVNKVDFVFKETRDLCLQALENVFNQKFREFEELKWNAQNSTFE